MRYSQKSSSPLDFEVVRWSSRVLTDVLVVPAIADGTMAELLLRLLLLTTLAEPTTVGRIPPFVDTGAVDIAAVVTAFLTDELQHDGAGDDDARVDDEANEEQIAAMESEAFVASAVDVTLTDRWLNVEAV